MSNNKNFVFHNVLNILEISKQKTAPLTYICLSLYGNNNIIQALLYYFRALIRRSIFKKYSGRVKNPGLTTLFTNFIYNKKM